MLDLMLPDINGMVVRQEIAAHAHTARIPIVIVTGATIDLSTLGVACVLRKPMTSDELVGVVTNCLTTGAQSVDL